MSRLARSRINSRSATLTAWRSTTGPGSTRSGSTRSTAAARSGRTSCRNCSRTTSARPRSGWNRRRSRRSRSRGSSRYRHLVSGHTFTLKEQVVVPYDGSSSHDGKYVLTSVNHTGRMSASYRSGDAQETALRQQLYLCPGRTATIDPSGSRPSRSSRARRRRSWSAQRARRSTATSMAG